LVSEAALARKQRFLDLKKEHGGNIAGIKEHYDNLDWFLWHEEDGTIVSMSKEDNTSLSERFERAVFSNEQIQILKDKNWNLYRIVVDKLNKHVKYIQVRPVEIDKILTDDFFLYQVDTQSNRGYDVKISLSSKTFSVSASSRLLEQYKDIDPSDAIINGRKIIPFYITSKNDPSFMFHTVNVNLEDIIKDKIVVCDLPTNLKGCSVFTLKLFEKYNFVEEKK
jgi:hypothetical protein